MLTRQIGGLRTTTGEGKTRTLPAAARGAVSKPFQFLSLISTLRYHRATPTAYTPSPTGEQPGEAATPPRPFLQPAATNVRHNENPAGYDAGTPTTRCRDKRNSASAAKPAAAPSQSASPPVTAGGCTAGDRGTAGDRAAATRTGETSEVATATPAGPLVAPSRPPPVPVAAAARTRGRRGGGVD